METFAFCTCVTGTLKKNAIVNFKSRLVITIVFQNSGKQLPSKVEGSRHGTLTNMTGHCKS